MPAAPRSVAPDTGFPVPILTRGRDIKLNARVSLRDRKNYGSVFGGVTMSEQYVRFGFDQKSGRLSRLLRSFRRRGKFRRQRERTVSDGIAKLLVLASRISGGRVGHEFARPVGLTARETAYRNERLQRPGARSSVSEFAMVKKFSRVLLYVAAAIGVSVPLGALAFVCLALIGF
jgi:hypothetical protein